jgi:hypothetical protein
MVTGKGRITPTGSALPIEAEYELREKAEFGDGN